MATGVNFDLELAVTGFKRNLAVASRSFSGFSKKVANDNKELGQSFIRLSSSITGKALNVAKTGLLALGAAIGIVGFAALKEAAKIEQLEIKFETLTGSAEKSKKIIKDLIDFAKKTPFQLVGISQASAKLLAFGVTA